MNRTLTSLAVQTCFSLLEKGKVLASWVQFLKWNLNSVKYIGYIMKHAYLNKELLLNPLS